MDNFKKEKSTDGAKKINKITGWVFLTNKKNKTKQNKNQNQGN